MGARIRAHDWSQTPLGPAEDWPQSLRSALSICLNSSFPIALYWGADLRLLYNDDWSAIPGEKHPWVLGRPASEAWPEIWDIISPLFRSVTEDGEATRRTDQLLPMKRHGFLEECYFDYTFSPIRGESGCIDGVFNAGIETTRRVIGERRLRTLRQLAERKSGEMVSVEDACRAATQTLSENPQDLPFALLYLLDADGRQLTLAGLTGLDRDSPAVPVAVTVGDEAGCPWPFQKVMESAQPVEVDDVIDRLGALSCGVWPEPPERAVVLPLAKAGQTELAGFVVAGVSPRLLMNDEYRGFMELLAGHIASAVINAKAYEEERQRAEELAELDRAKTAFFSNVSHEFRTPLTLMLGPVEELLNSSKSELTQSAERQLEVVSRNGQRLLRLVNTLLDFSRIEAGRVRAIYQPTDLATFTTDLASNFRSAFERAKLTLTVDCPALDGPAFVDREMWEKIVLNLLSNAFKFTFEGGITVTLRSAGDSARLRVRDTGPGIPAAEMPRLFERFHRVSNARGRTHEGSGIGLALVQELVQLHGGAISAESVVGEGTTFTVTLPLGSAHLPSDQLRDGSHVVSSGTGADPFVEEALRWLPDPGLTETASEMPLYVEPLSSAHRLTQQVSENDRPKVLVVDDNSDMRQYIARLLSEHFHIETAHDGEAALAVIRDHLPDLVLADVMMPRLDGFGLLRQLRAHPRTRHVPVIMLSARAGEESRVEGVHAGADDYIVKPFSGRELVARVATHLQMARLRRESELAIRESEQRFRALVTASSDAIYQMGADWTELHHLNGGAFIADTFKPIRNWLEKYIYPDDMDLVTTTIDNAISNKSVFELEHRVLRVDGTLGWTFSRAVPLLDDSGEVVEWFGAASDTTRRKQAEMELQQERDLLRVTLASIGDAVITTDTEGRITNMNAVAESLTGWPVQKAQGEPLEAVFRIVNESTRKPVANPATGALQRGDTVGLADHTILIARGGTESPIENSAAPIRSTEGEVIGCVMVFRDVTQRRRSEQALRQREEHFRSMADNAPTMIWVTDPTGSCTYISKQWCEHTGTLRSQNLGIGWMQSVHPDDRQAAEATFVKANNRQAAFSLDYRLRRHDGIYRWAVDTALPRFDEQGHFQGFVGTVTDIHERKETNEALGKAAADLAEADQLKNEFLATLAHELRNPLAPIRNGVQLIGLADGNWDSVEQARSIIDRQLNQLVRLVDDLMDVSRISTGKLHLRREQITLSSVVMSAVETSRPLIDQMAHDFSVTLPECPVYLNADQTRLAQVFLNLLNNAAKYSKPNGRIQLTAETRESEVVVAVKDNGIGILPEQLPRVFEMFSQVDPSLDRSQGGLGIGLSLVKRLVELHGGTIEARSEGLGKGSEFVVRLPVTEEAAVPRVVAPSMEGDQPTLRILIVDDNKDGADSLAIMLGTLGHEVSTAYDGEEAISAVPRFRPDVILLDIGMPKLDGHEACRRIRKLEAGQEITIIAQTGWGQDEDRQRTQEAEFDYHLVKPVDPEALVKLLRSISNRGSRHNILAQQG